jgi:hypothetical protein
VLEISVTCWAEAEAMRVRRARNECRERKPIVENVGSDVQEANDGGPDHYFKKYIDGVPSGGNE